MIKLVRKDDLTCPLVLCDRCQEEIQDYTEGYVTWNESLEYRHIHKGRCDDRKNASSCSLAEHLAYLCLNVHFVPKAYANEVLRLDEGN